MYEFERLHPIVSFVYFTLVIALSCIIMHPVCIGISLFSGAVYSVMLGGAKRLRFDLLCILPLMLLAAAINPLFNHRGMTILCYLPGGNPLTLESLYYGAASGAMLGSVIFHFYNCTKILTSDKFIWLFGRVIPTLSLLLSMTLGFIPKFKARLRVAAAGQKSLEHGTGFFSRLASGTRALSAAVSMSLEDAASTADGMKGRGYGLPGRTAYSNFRFDRRDLITLCVMIISGGCVITGYIVGALRHRYFPTLRLTEPSPALIGVFTTYLLLCAAPIIIEVLEGRKWK